MKILYAIQGTGNGHMSRATAIYPELEKYGAVDLLVSGYQSDLNLPFPVTHRLKGLSFIFGKHGGVSLWNTFKRLDPFCFLRDVFRLPVEEYDLVVNDFEPVSAWACRLRKVPCIALSHQSAVVHAASPRPVKKGWFGKFILRYYAPFSEHYGFHFKCYDDRIFPPVIRKEVQSLPVSEGKHYTVYLPAYNDAELICFLHRFKGVSWEVFSKHNKEAFRFENIHIRPVENETFLKSLAACEGALLGAGFEGPAEALYLHKKLMVVPMKRQYEQQCNAAALQQLGVPVIPSLSVKYFRTVNNWMISPAKVKITFPQRTASVAVGKMIEDYISKSAQTNNGSVPGFF